jgi:hypothetical protein
LAKISFVLRKTIVDLRNRKTPPRKQLWNLFGTGDRNAIEYCPRGTLLPAIGSLRPSRRGE